MWYQNLQITQSSSIFHAAFISRIPREEAQQKQIIKKKRKKEKTREPEAASLPVTSQLSHDILHLGRRIACACWLRNNRRLTAVRAAVLHLWMSSMVLLMWWRRKWCRCTAAERP
jgi:hypothetical protein